MKLAIILSGLGVIFALVTGLLAWYGESYKVGLIGVIALIFEVVGVGIAIGYMIGGF